MSLSAHQRGQVLRVLRITAVALLMQSAVASFVSSALLRYPLIGVGIAVVEAVVRQLRPVKALPPAPVPVPGPSRVPPTS